MIIKGNIVDVVNKTIFKGELLIENERIKEVRKSHHSVETYILPGFVDAHIHIESSMLVPTEFAKIALTHGTVATVSDPHEIANVLGVKGVDFMIDNAKQSPLQFNFGAPSCVPATTFETAGATIDAAAVKSLLERPEIKYLSEVMNYPGVIYEDSEVLQKVAWAKHFQKPIDGHAPAVRGENLTKYIAAGISTDHECFTKEEALEKLQNGMKILIREGSAAKNFEALISLLSEFYEDMMFCSDDKHPDDLLLGHINLLCKRAVAKGIDVLKVLQVACVNPVKHYNLEVGLLQTNDFADFIIVDSITEFNVLETYIRGNLVAKKGKAFVEDVSVDIHNNFSCDFKTVSDFEFHTASDEIQVIEALDGELITKKTIARTLLENGNCISNTKDDILKITVVNRYQNTQPAIAFIKNFGLKSGAIASSVAHDSHNIIAVGATDAALCKAVNTLIKHKGGICAVGGDEEHVLPLPIAGIMTAEPAEKVAQLYSQLDAKAKKLGSQLKAPFMSLSFMALLVIPSLKLSDKGLFDGEQFKFTALEIK